MALLDLKAKQTAEIELKHPDTDLPMGIFITIHGKDSDKFKSIVSKQNNRRIEESLKSRNGRIRITDEKQKRDGMELLVGCTESWRTGTRPEIEFADNEWLAFTPENIQKVYENIDWIKDQVDQDMTDRAIFLQK